MQFSNYSSFQSFSLWKVLVATLLSRSKIFPEGDALVEQGVWRLVGKSVRVRLMSIEVFLDG
jgi:hypothetical protein